MKKVLIILIVFISLCSCSNQEVKDKFSYTKIDNEKMLELMQEHDYIIFDVRTKEEYDTLHIKGAINLPYDEINSPNHEVADIIFVYCKSGTRSKKAAEILLEAGYEVYDLGGIDNIDLPKE